MQSHSPKKIMAIACMDCRHSGELEEKLASHFGCACKDIYVVRVGGGFGNFASLKDAEGKDGMLVDVKIGITALEIPKVVGLIHGSCDNDPKGCGAYAVAGFGDEFSTSERSDAFVTKELNEASRFLRDWLDENGHSQVAVETMSACFGKEKENILTECQCPDRQESRSPELVAA